MLQITRTSDGFVVQSLNGKKLRVKEQDGGYSFDRQWWPREEGGAMLRAVEQALHIA